MDDLDKTNQILVGGPCLDASCLIIILQTQSMKDAEALISVDPSVQASIVDYKIHPYQISVGKIKQIL